MFDKLNRKLGLDISPENLRIRAEQMHALIAALPAMIGANLLLELLVVWLMWGKLDHRLLLLWLATLCAIHAQEITHWLRYPKEIRSIKECKRWQRQFLWSFNLVGAVWGIAGVFMFIPGEPVLQAFMLCVMIGLAAAVVASNQALLPAQQGFVVLVLLPILFTMLLQGDRDYYLLAAMVLLFLAFVAKAGRDHSRNLELSIRRAIENAELVNNLRRVNEQLTVAQLAAQAGVWDWDIAAGRMTWSDELFLLFGLEPGSLRATFAAWRRIIHPADLGKAEKTVAETIRNGRMLFSEYRIVLPDGKTKWILAQGESTRDERGVAVRMTGLCFDISAQKEAQRRAQQAESRFQTLIEQAGSALLVHDLEGNVLEVNRQACETHGYSREELLKLTLRDISVGFDLPTARECWRQLESGTPATFTATHRRKDGSTFPVEVRLSSIVLDEQKLVMALASDISDRLRVETALQQSEERYRTFAEKLPLGITVLQDGAIKYVNLAMSQLLGYAVEELLNKPFGPLIHEEDAAWAKELHRQRMQGEDVKKVFPVRMVRKDGVVRQWELHTSTSEWDGKRASLAIVTDITDRVAMEEALRSSLRQLEEKELAKTRFLAAAGHDLRQPVAAANLFVDALKNTSPNQRQSELIARLDQSMTIFSGLLERLLDISKFDAGLIEPQIGSFNLLELFDWLEQNFAESARERKLRFGVSFPMHRRLIVRTDIGLLQSVMMNLVSNAIKYTSKGGILVAARPRRDRILLQVWDTGCGIAEADIDKIFDEFYQVDNPQRNREAGLGLGLSICRRAAALLGSGIACRSRLGRGSMFELSIPLDHEHQAVGHFLEYSEPDKAFDESLFEGKRVAVLEDDQLVAEGVVNLLQGRGAHVLHFLNAEEALKHRGITAADYFVVDYSLGGQLTGAAFLHALQGRTEKPIKGVIVTGETSSNFIEGIADLPWPVLHKPINYAKLASVLSS